MFEVSPLTHVLFWAGLLIACGIAAIWIMRAAAKAPASASDSDVALYRSQLDELARDVADGRIEPAAAEAGRLEIGRRLLKAEARSEQFAQPVGAKVASAFAVLVVGMAAALYLVLGKPGMPDAPFAAREAELLTRDPGSLSLSDILVLLQERARQNPEDATPHALMGQILSDSGREQDALRAYQAALRRAPNNPEVIAQTGALLARMNDGKAGADAMAAFDAALKLDPNSPTARFQTGLIDWQAGNKDQALANWRAAFLANRERPDAQILLASRVSEVLSVIERGPDQAAAAQMGQSSDSDRAAFIQTMVNARLDRVRANPADPALRLSAVRVLSMTGQTAQAVRLLQDGGAQTKDPFILALYAVTARSLSAQPQSQQSAEPAPAMPKR